MAKLERRLAYYDNGTIEEGKTNRKTFKTEGLIGVLAFYDDGSREQEATVASGIIKEDKQTLIQRLRLEAHKEYKSDGGDTLEIKALTRIED
jgi:hypothetical protein